MNRVIVVGTSAGGLHALGALLGYLPADLPAAILLVMHIGSRFSVLPEVLQRHSALPVAFAQDRQELVAGTVVVAPPDRHLLVMREGAALRAVLSCAAKENHTRPAIDPLFRTVAEAADGRAVGVILSGYLDDGVAGLQAIKACGGVAVAQDPAEAAAPDMPRNAVSNVALDLCAPLQEIAAALTRYARTPPPAAGAHEIPSWLRTENRIVADGGDLKALQQIASPSNYACPACGGVLFEMTQRRPTRYRCHTGHAFSALSLLLEQQTVIEESLRSAVRALHEKESLAEQLAAESTLHGRAPEADYAGIARRCREEAAQLLALLAG
ncbi:chemotaxis protein CheB [Duganella radicis]|uniref:chemotaxis protein CheB n=1 Tax=Duganella radicis TaxID=551988 RepID=UPI00147896E5